MNPQAKMETNIKTEFNSNTATLERVDDTLKKCANASLVGDWVSWANNLEILKREAIVKMHDITKIEKCKDGCVGCICLEKFKRLDQIIQVYRTSKLKDYLLINDIRRKLDDCEMFIRAFMDKKGMLLREAEDEATRALR